jgi:hypothetical protein
MTVRFTQVGTGGLRERRNADRKSADVRFSMDRSGE